MTKLYNELVREYKRATDKPHWMCDKDMKEKWESCKKLPDFPQNVRDEISLLKQKSSRKQKTLDKFWSKVPKKSVESVEAKVLPSQVVEVTDDAPDEAVASAFIGADDIAKSKENGRVYNCPADDELSRVINSLREDVVHLTRKRNSGLATDSQLQELKQKSTQLAVKEARLKKVRGDRSRQRNWREEKKKILKDNPELAAKLRMRGKVGRPSLEVDQPELLKTIVDIAIHGSKAEERRRSEEMRSIKSLDELTAELREKFSISRSAVYLRLLPKRGNTSEGKRHVTTVPVRLCRASNDAHKSHMDTQFCRATIRYLEEMASTLGPSQVLFISQDDKARVPIGITAANKQAPMLMHVDYAVKLPDHDWVIAERHKLIPSVYGIMEVKPKMLGDPRAVTYSGPTYITIRSGKHCSSTALSHARDLNSLLGDQELFQFTRESSGDIKPVLMLIVDGGPDENPRYEKVINAALDHFKRFNFDAIFIATNAPGRSAFNRVERRMAPLSRELCGLILQHDFFGSHLDQQSRTVDAELEKRNFEHAGQLLGEIWSSVVINGFPTKATYIPPEESEQVLNDLPNAEWKAKHVRESHYFLQIVKCTDPTCCRPFRGNYLKAFSRFVPAPLCIDEATLTQSDNSDLSNQFPSLMLRLRVSDISMQNEKSKEVPYDIYCPSVKELLPSRTCGNCGLYFASVKSVKSHQKVCKRQSALIEDQFGNNLFEELRPRRPVRVAARRQRERMLIWTSRLNEQHADWFDEEGLENVEVLEQQNENPNPPMNIVTVQTHMEIPWEDE